MYIYNYINSVVRDAVVCFNFQGDRLFNTIEFSFGKLQLLSLAVIAKIH